MSQQTDLPAIDIRDIAHLLRDMLELHEGDIACVFGDDGSLSTVESGVSLDDFDLTDPRKPVLHLSNGQSFTLTIAQNVPV